MYTLREALKEHYEREEQWQRYKHISYDWCKDIKRGRGSDNKAHELGELLVQEVKEAIAEAKAAEPVRRRQIVRHLRASWHSGMCCIMLCSLSLKKTVFAFFQNSACLHGIASLSLASPFVGQPMAELIQCYVP